MPSSNELRAIEAVVLKPIDRLDLASVPPAIALPLLAEALRAIASEKFPILSDLSCDLTIDASRGICTLSFRACR